MGGVPEPVESLDRRRQALEVRPGQASVAGVVVLALEEVRGPMIQKPGSRDFADIIPLPALQ